MRAWGRSHRTAVAGRPRSVTVPITPDDDEFDDDVSEEVELAPADWTVTGPKPKTKPKPPPFPFGFCSQKETSSD
jgi:hypothetical protein